VSSEKQEKEVLGAQVDEIWMICSGPLKWGWLGLGRELAKFIKPAGSVLSRPCEPGKVRKMMKMLKDGDHIPIEVIFEWDQTIPPSTSANLTWVRISVI
jgi:hypothetical protein